MLQQATISTSARLHLGFFDLSKGQETKRHFGSIGVAIDAYQTKLTVKKVKNEPSALNVDAWVTQVLQRQLALAPSKHMIDVEVESQIPRHAGLGSGTQMALALGCAVNTLFQQPFDPKQVALHHQRGERSGIGIYTFQHGGLVIDGGHTRIKQHKSFPPMLARYDFPKDWRFILIADSNNLGIHGKAEKQAFAELKHPSINDTQAVSHQILLNLLPAIVEHDYASVSQSLGVLQRYNAECFGVVQGGQYASQYVAQALEYLKTKGYQGLGQSSWGPTGFVLVPSQDEAITCLNALQNTMQKLPLTFTISSAVNKGADIKYC